MTEIGRESKTKPKNKRNRAWRMNLYFLVVFVLFAALIFKLGVVQIVEGEKHIEDAQKANAKTAYYPAPRGKMYDKQKRVAVDNQAVPEIVYVSTSKTTTEDKLKTAKNLSSYISIDTKFLKDRDLRDFWLASHPKKAPKLLKKSEDDLNGTEAYKRQVKRVPEEELKALKKNKKELEIAAIFTRFSSGNSYEPQVVKSMDPNKISGNGSEGSLLDESKNTSLKPKSDLTYEEVSLVSEHLEELPGIDVVDDWTRKYPFDKTLYSVFGGVTTPEQGLLSDRKDYYLTRGYSRNDRVGKSYLEYQYEDYLNSHKAKVEYVENSKGEVTSQKTIDKGSRGYDLQLSFDMELQAKVEKIIEEELRNSRARGNYMVDRAFVVMMDPNNGDILTMAGKRIDLETNKLQDYAIGAFTTQYEMGSSVKGATVLSGYQAGLPHYQTFVDRTLYFKGKLKKSSYTNMGSITELTALQRSSNVYMFNVAMHIAGVTYKPYGALPADQEDLRKMRNYYSQFGLGVKTGIDLPQESAGMQTTPDAVGGLILDLAIGQYDTYTPLQLVQYMSSIANGGYRIQPRIVTSVHKPGRDDKLGTMIEERQPKILNKINNSASDIEQVKAGLKKVTSTGGTAAGVFGTNDVSGKTGTAQTFYYGTNKNWWGLSTYNLTFAGYYPSTNPQVAFSVVVPSVRDDHDEITKKIEGRAIDAYVKLQKSY
ncbi:penicillin-binding protein 2 [Bacillus atrophaeus]|uniref:peptidoglycan D,D-transpeptidase FtsI family protein n=1 Tax=Bacillus atrophaeus TaxID=1452 RepID=UPI00115B67A1|nr:penicillin-binding protein 2 [Bacillus atrophaeus]MCY7947866.1 penicillin-binding protein 2 [Bacillus atrophaeus]MCY8097681.1 penicillin-binding protein 2 [Bacillus atrophaeus]MCY8809666.1 penicillin-binding protein 2 [Bacillus atrophaeus]MCY9167347.1 penicillin-binding protein 2 [Bacillus atrophaeus]MEC0741283.1 penicillin-binding protein 2 [Bacillus atrophaeus]